MSIYIKLLLISFDMGAVVKIFLISWLSGLGWPFDSIYYYLMVISTLVAGVVYIAFNVYLSSKAKLINMFLLSTLIAPIILFLIFLLEFF